RLHDDLRVVSPEDAGQRVLDAAQELRRVGLRGRVRRGGRLDAVTSEVPLRSRHVEIDREVERPVERARIVAYRGGRHEPNVAAPVFALLAVVDDDDPAGLGVTERPLRARRLRYAWDEKLNHP